MPYTVFFKESAKIIAADNFIYEQPVVHQRVLKTLADELAVKGTITNPQATRNSKGEWRILLNDNGDVYIYTLFICDLERSWVNPTGQANAPEKKYTLVVIDPSGPRDSVGGYHPGYWTVGEYANFLEENQKVLFTQVVYEIENNIPSENYCVRIDGSVSIRIEKKTETTSVSLSCRADWI